MVWLCENDLREMGIALGTVTADRPDRIVMTYADVLGGDLNADAQGSLVFTPPRAEAAGAVSADGASKSPKQKIRA